jgi:Leucine Rich repeat
MSNTPLPMEFFSVQEYTDQICHRLVDLEVKACRISHSSFSHQHAAQVSVALGRAGKLRKLDIVNCRKLGPESVVELCGALMKSEVSHLSLESVPLGSAGLAAVTRLLRHRWEKWSVDTASTMRVKSLGLEGSIDFSTLDVRVWHEFASVACQTLDSLDLGRNKLWSPDHARVLSGAVGSFHGTDCRLLALILSDNPIGDAGFETLCRALARNRTLVLLACGECNISYSCGVRCLTECLRSNPSLQRLYTYGNNGTHGGATFCATFLDGPQSSELQYWLELNGRGRALLRTQQRFPRGLIPFVLARSSDRSTILYGLLREVPYVWR